MTNKSIATALDKLNNISFLQNESGYWVFKLDDVILMIITDETHNRMRVISEITSVSNINEQHMHQALQAHFHKALDIKYAIYNESIWSVFTHTLQELTETSFIDAISQVYSGAINFGSSYSSSNLFFGSGDD